MTPVGNSSETGNLQRFCIFAAAWNRC